MSDETRRCLKCDGVVQGPLPAGALVCGAAVPDTPETRKMPKTDCAWSVVKGSPPDSLPVMTDTDRYVEVKCRMCGWLHLIAPRERDHPCEAVASCAGTVSDPEDRTFECVPQGFRSRVAALLKAIEYNGRDEFDSRACPCCRDNPYGPSPPIHNPDDCELAALLRECGA